MEKKRYGKNGYLKTIKAGDSMFKKLVLALLFATNILIIASGTFFTIYAYRNNITFLVLNARMPGFIFGLVTIFLGIRYIRALLNLRKEISAPEIKFSWSNFLKRT